MGAGESGEARGAVGLIIKEEEAVGFVEVEEAVVVEVGAEGGGVGEVAVHREERFGDPPGSGGRGGEVGENFGAGAGEAEAVDQAGVI